MPSCLKLQVLQAEEQADFNDLGGAIMSIETSRETARLLAMLTASGSSKVSFKALTILNTIKAWSVILPSCRLLSLLLSSFLWGPPWARLVNGVHVRLDGHGS